MKNKQTFKYFFLFFLILQPFLDCYLLYSDPVIDFFGFSPTTILRMIVIGIYCIITFLTTRRGRNIMIYYSIILMTYFIIHHVACTSIDENLIYHTFKYSLIEEIFYFARMFLPIGTIYIVYNLNITKEDLRKVIKYSSIAVALIIIVLNVTGYARASYGGQKITGTIFSWLDPNYESIDLASKGWFNSANQIGATIIILITMMNYFTLKNPSKENTAILCSLILSSMMVGTRTATIIVCYIVVIMFISYLVISDIHNRSLTRKSILINLCILLATFAIYGFAPVANCHYSSNYVCLVKLDNGLDSSETIKYKKNLKFNGDTCNFLKETPTNPVYYEDIYPCNENIDFWTEYSKTGAYKYANNRTLELMVTKDVYKRIKNPMVRLFGMSRSRFLSAETYLEKDIYVHYYTIGIIGVILFLIVPYTIPCILYGIHILKKKKFTAYNVTMCTSTLIIFLASYMSGHILDELIATIYMGFIIGALLNDTYPKKNKPLTEHVLIVNDERMMGGVSILLEDILNNIDKSIEVDLLILSNHGTRLKKLPSNVHFIRTTKFFNVIDLNIKEVLKTKNIILIIKKIYLVFLIKTKLIKYKVAIERDKILTHQYKLEIAFKDGFCGLFTGYGDSLKKVAWLHSDYAKKDFSAKYRSQFLSLYENFDKIVAVSTPVANNFNEIYHQHKKTIVINNLVDTKKIIKLSKKENIKYSETLNFVSVGRLHIDKGFDRAINALARLKQEGLLENIKYRLIGDGEEYDNLKTLVKEANLTDEVELLGKLENPYPYVAASDAFLMTSIHESFGLVIVEALTLKVPVISVKLATTNELLKPSDGILIDNNEESIYDAIKKIIKNKDILNKYCDNLKSYNYDNQKIITLIEKLLKDK